MHVEEYINTTEKTDRKQNRKNRKKASDRSGLVSFLLLITGVLSGALVMCLILIYTGAYTLPKKSAETVISVGDVKTENESVIDESFSDELLEAESMAAENAEHSDGTKYSLGALRTMLIDGTSTTDALRAVFADDLVGGRDGRYYFTPIDRNLKMHNFDETSVEIGEDGSYNYTFEDGSLAKRGIDVSKYQGEINWEEVASSGIEFAFIRAGIRGYESGKLVMDEGFAGNITGAINAGLDVGTYFFSQASNKAEAIEEAETVIEALNGNGLSLPLVIDVEYIKGGRCSKMDRDELTDVTLAFCDRVREAGYTPMIYGNLDTFAMMLDMSRLEDIEKWLAYYDTDFYFPYEFSIWQYTDSGRINGIEETVDLNLYMKH